MTYAPPSDLIRGRGATRKSTGRTRRVWTSREEKCLITSLKEIVSQGWKSDNGFRTGYLTKLEEAMKKEFPLTDIIANPNITSKLTTWKKSYGSIVTALGTTSVGFNTVTNQLDCTDEQWESILKKDPTMRGMRYKEWTLYPDWIEIFGKDRATGENAEDVNVAANKTRRPTSVPSVTTDADFNGDNFVYGDGETTPIKTPNQSSEDGEEDSTACGTTRSAPPLRNESKKRKSRQQGSDPALVKLLGDFCHATASRLETIAQRIGYDKDLGIARKGLFEELGNIPGLTIRDRLKVSKTIGRKVEDLEMWMGLPDDARAIYVMDILEEDGI